ncbi:MAG: hypothetical protein Q8941_18635 [Bacteroidota bacterium]|nr:hypothetical protein [Bacteroidota bacterium]
MKKIILIATLIVTGFINAEAQTENGTVLLGGDISFETSNGNGVFTASPRVGYFVVKNFAVGGEFNLLTSEGFTSWAIGPFVRGYFAGTEQGKFYGQLGVNVGGATGSNTRVGFGIGAGYAIFLNRSIAIDLGLNYNKTGDTNGIFGIGAGFQIHFKK